MFKKSFLITIAASLALIFLLSGLVAAQANNDVKKKYEELVEQVRELDQKMKKATAEEYEALLKQRQSLVEEVTKYRSMLEGDQDTKKQIIEVKKKFNDGTKDLKLRRYTNAIGNFQACVSQGEALNTPLINDYIAMAYYQMGQAFKAQKNWAKMQDSMQHAVNVKSDYEKAYFELGYSYERLSRLEEAERAYSTALEINPSYTKAHFNLGVLFFKKKHYDRAIEEFMGVINIDQQNDTAFKYLGRAYFEKKEYGSAETALRQSVQLDAKDREAYWYLAQTLNKTGQYNEAVEAATSLINISKSFGGGYLERGIAYKNLGQKTKALADFEAAKKDKQFRQLADYQIKWYDKGI